MSADYKEQNEFNDLLKNQELTNSLTEVKELIPEAESSAGDEIIDGTCPLIFEGNSVELFGILLNNFFLNLLTLGIYYPWAKAKQLRYYYGVTRIHESNFQFNGTGGELFIGLFKALGVLLILDFAYEGMLAVAIEEWSLLLLGLVYLLAFLLLVLIASVGARRYRMSRTSWRGIRFRFYGTFKTTGILIAKGWLLTLLSLGLYYPYYLNRFQSYWISKTFFGNIAFSYNGQVREISRIWIKGILLSIITLGIYLFWLRADLQRYFWSHTSYGESRIISNLHGGKWFKESLIFLFIVIITFGVGRAWALVRYKRFYLGTFHIEGKINLAEIKQAEVKMTSAVGEGMADFFDVKM